MTNIRLYALLAALLLGGWKMQAQEPEPTEILPSPTIIAYHLCNWDDETILLNGAVLGDGLYVMKIDEEGHLLDSAVWFHSTNTCSFLTESKFFRLSDGSLCFYYVKGPDRPVMSKVSISENLDLTVFEFPDPFPIPEGIPTDRWWDFEWLPNDDGSVFVSSAYIDGSQSVHVMARYNEAGELTHQRAENTDRATTSLLPRAKGASGCRLVMDDPDAKDVNSECVIFDDSLNVVDIKHSIYNQAIGIYRPHYEYFAVHPETGMVYLLSDVNFPAFNGNPKIGQDVYMSQFNPDFTQTKYVMGPYTVDEHDQKALCEAIDFHGDDIYMCGSMNIMAPGIVDPMESENFYVALLDGNMNLKGEIYYHSETRFIIPYSILALQSGGCLVTTGGQDRRTGEQQHAIFKISEETLVGIDEAHEAGFAVAVAYPNPGKEVLNIRTGLQNARVEVYDLSGKLICNQEITENVTSINAESWPSGVYVWKVYTNQAGPSTLRWASGTAGSGTLAETGKWIKE